MGMLISEEFIEYGISSLKIGFGLFFISQARYNLTPNPSPKERGA
jgi:hypothetical protein